MKILFVCKYNKFRSRLAESAFNSFNKDKNNIARSAGLIKGSPTSLETIKICKKFGVHIRGSTKGLS